MSSKLPWTRLFADKWAIVVDYLPAVEGNIYMRLRLRMLHTGEPLFYNIKVLSHYTGYSVKKFEAALNVLLEEGYLIRLADGRLWNLDVEEELNNSNESLEKVSKISRSKKFSERAKKAAQARWDKHTNDACDDAKVPENPDKNDAKVIKHDANSMLKDAKHDAYDMLNDAYIYNINNNTNINSYNKKTKTIVLAKKEIGSENLETTDLVDEPTEVAAVETTSEQIETVVENQPPIHEQESVSKKAKRTKSKDGFRLPDDFEPNLQYAIDKGLTHDEALLEFERFKLHWKDNPCRNAKKSDWQKAWYKWVTHPEYGMLAKKKARLEQEKQYGKQTNSQTEQQRGWNYRVTQHMSDIKNSDSMYKFLFENGNRTTIPLENGAKTIDCRSGESYLISP
ncbi:DUF1376 domain-containing protein [Bartonella taylorii]|uniref:DUF1376 domain-containing protein n=1 Tax=Bartonella taylorii TaxID=33046 RepID=UPI001ABA1A14|nr:DUF1376 domain-containing protein [Bartonella taylorii]